MNHDERGRGLSCSGKSLSGCEISQDGATTLHPYAGASYHDANAAHLTALVSCACPNCRESWACSSSSAFASQKLPPNTTGSGTTNRQRHLRRQALTAVTTFTPRASDKESRRFERGLNYPRSISEVVTLRLDGKSDEKEATV